ncbi:glycosyltransferase family 4 protein [Azospirillum picis]|uniref:Glycosyltransferase involved in cell wall biosynthesis n=1 Tax=Azospirillum picis TaxID=488438 RepID=A0ABU0MU40_9PROT|nr:glycosyltransferase family 4 protein [Azospirillum picis]MBP2300901.1 glycosyltransferase involved in cell wall biosynthesis [Azospirillum picis]MDQ0537005.1 glycosyltransferase involved in cell wall biosynthesis [Azospirillum picis]
MKILYLAHNHPQFHPGGTEIFAHDLFQEMNRRPGVEALFLAGTSALQRLPSPGTPFQTVGRSAREMLVWTGGFDRFNLSQVDIHGVLPELERLLREVKPDVVHAHHTLLLGVEAFAVVRRAVPKARLVLTLHDYHAICHNDGLMVAPAAAGRPPALCRQASPDACHRCFPDIARMEFRLRELYIQRHLGLVDRFVAPSRFAAERHRAWGIDPARLGVIRNGRPAAAPVPARPAEARAAEPAFAVFGNISPMKGTLVALEAARLVAQRTRRPFSLTLHGAPLFQADAFVGELQAAVAALRATGTVRVRQAGAYVPTEVPALMAAVDWVIVPSVWWENAPLVIDEAFRHRRPVLCSAIGGMAEAVRDGVDGLQFAAGDAAALAERMLACLDEPGLWERLSAAAPEPWDIAASADAHLELYRSLRRSSSPARAAAAAKTKGTAKATAEEVKVAEVKVAERPVAAEIGA